LEIKLKFRFKFKKAKIEENKKEQVQEIKSMHDNFSRPVDFHSNRKGKWKWILFSIVLSIAQKENVSFDELQSIKGTGLEGRVSKKDIIAYIEKRKTTGSSGSSEKKPKVTIPSTSQTVYNAADVEKIPMDNIRQRIMDHMVHSRDTSVHVTGLIEVDMTEFIILSILKR
jgi:pyruvate/2-oxoglutarate dehydrogenase complex dihydrolipoamide acyltransferase (E2) component